MKRKDNRPVRQARRATQARRDRWHEIMRRYRRRHHMWVMEVLPTMLPDQWKAYEKWVAEFGAQSLSMTSNRGRRVKRRLRAARKIGYRPR